MNTRPGVFGQLLSYKRWIMKFLAFSGAFALSFLACLFAVPASAATIEVGSAFGIFAPYVDAVLGLGVVLLVGWVSYVAKNKLNLSIDDSARAALETFLKNQAQNLVAKGAVKLNGVTIEVNSVALATAANAAIKFIPDAMARFGLTPEVVADKIKAVLPAVPSVAQAQAVAIDVANPATPSKPA